ncbi:hypothetical protein RSK60_2610001 [Ralstonia solanacearum K60]|nr:hypothetical protein RSK60_2610001 [Ralstonia solanacearum K60]
MILRKLRLLYALILAVLSARTPLSASAA